MYTRIKRLYESGRINKNGVRNAVLNRLITPEQYKTITGEDYVEDNIESEVVETENNEEENIESEVEADE